MKRIRQSPTYRPLPEERSSDCARSWVWVLLPLFILLLPSTGRAQVAEGFFRQNCVSCHTIGGGRLTGPDLKDLSTRQDRAWLVDFMLNPKSVIDSGDPYALELMGQSRDVVMPTIAGLAPDLVTALLDLIDMESDLPESQFQGLQFSDRPFTAADIEKGRQIFLGTGRLVNEGPACISCHTMRGLGGLGGGRLGPDLTRVYERLQGRKNLAAWLFAPATTTMQPLFQNHPLRPEEILPLVAAFEAAARDGGEDDSVAILVFLFWALGGTILALVGLDAAWKWRFRAVRAPLISKDGLNRS